ncbi:MAG: hypothetical protein C0508_11510 [Cyanobacteria bacterium PR.023]|jgi:hypothetical protein|nr:hypothetical protein [Cyanobacteria bacterium PR.023]
MSADNGVYILKTRSQSGHSPEYRIGYASAIDNITQLDRREADKFTRAVFGQSMVMNTYKGALSVAKGIHYDLVKSGVYIEYGVVLIELSKQFPRSRRSRRRHRTNPCNSNER